MADENKGAGAAQGTEQPPAGAQGNAQPDPKGAGQDGKPTDREAELLKENMAMKKRLKSFEQQQEDAEKKALTEQGKHKELAEKAEKKAGSLAERLVRAELLSRLPGLIKPDLIKLCDVSSVKVQDDGSIDGLEEIAEAFKTANPEYFHAGGDSKPPVPGTPKPGTTARGVGFRTWEEYEKAPREEQIAWAQANPQAFNALAKNAMRPKGL